MPTSEFHVPRTGELNCGVVFYAGDPPCTRQADWHVTMRTPKTVDFLTCRIHLAGLEAAPLYVITGRHPAHADCGMPGMGWETDASQKVSYCAPLD